MQTNNIGYYESIRTLLKPYFDNASNTYCFQSGENSQRNYYIYNVLNHLVYERGIPALVLCDTNVYKTRYFLNKLPEPMKTKFLRHQTFREYLDTIELGRKMLEQLYLSQENLDVIELFLVGLRRLTARLIEQLTKDSPNMVFLIDRSPFTGALYSKALRKDLHVEDLAPLFNYRPRAHFFIESTQQASTPLDLQLYDSFSGLNVRINQLANKIKAHYPWTIVYENQDLNHNLKEILTVIDKTLS